MIWTTRWVIQTPKRVNHQVTNTSLGQKNLDRVIASTKKKFNWTYIVSSWRDWFTLHVYEFSFLLLFAMIRERKSLRKLIIVTRVLLNLNFAKQVAALLDHLSIFAICNAVIVIHLVVVDVIEICRVGVSKKGNRGRIEASLIKNFSRSSHLVVILVSMLCVIVTAFSSSLSIRLLLPVLVGSSLDRRRSCNWITLFAVAISWLIMFEQNCVVTRKR